VEGPCNLLDPRADADGWEGWDAAVLTAFLLADADGWEGWDAAVLTAFLLADADGWEGWDAAVLPAFLPALEGMRLDAAVLPAFLLAIEGMRRYGDSPGCEKEVDCDALIGMFLSNGSSWKNEIGCNCKSFVVLLPTQTFLSASGTVIFGA
jgi:hypothetical protein